MFLRLKYHKNIGENFIGCKQGTSEPTTCYEYSQLYITFVYNINLIGKHC